MKSELLWETQYPHSKKRICIQYFIKREMAISKENTAMGRKKACLISLLLPSNYEIWRRNN